MDHDSRKKACPNAYCDMHTKKKLFKPSYYFCPVCSEKLVFVCPKCFERIEDIGPEHKYCSRCEAAQSKPKTVIVAQNAARQISKAGRKTGGALKQVGGTFGVKAKSTGRTVKNAMEANHVTEELLNAGVRAVKEMGTDTIREAGKTATNVVKKAVKRK